ncbi:MAG: hypothetical protein R3A13_02040 [Bdellovibrionota bacterium]
MFKKFRQLLIAALILTFTASSALARPVSYPGGTTVMSKNDERVNSFHLHYSPTAKYSVGYRGEYWHDDEFYLHSAAVNVLLRRWNMPRSQANFYLKSGLGFAYSDYQDFDSEYEPLAYSGVSLDWENQRFFVMYENRGIYADDIDRSYHQKARLGIAPYIGEYGDLHTWLMVEFAHHPGTEDSFSITPLLRFFYSVYMAEVGVSTDGDLTANLVIRF